VATINFNDGKRETIIAGATLVAEQAIVTIRNIDNFLQKHDVESLEFITINGKKAPVSKEQDKRRGFSGQLIIVLTLETPIKDALIPIVRNIADLAPISTLKQLANVAFPSKYDDVIAEDKDDFLEAEGIIPPPRVRRLDSWAFVPHKKRETDVETLEAGHCTMQKVLLPWISRDPKRGHLNMKPFILEPMHVLSSMREGECFPSLQHLGSGIFVRTADGVFLTGVLIGIQRVGNFITLERRTPAYIGDTIDPSSKPGKLHRSLLSLGIKPSEG
jgi:hypothetical protein